MIKIYFGTHVRDQLAPITIVELIAGVRIVRVELKNYKIRIKGKSTNFDVELNDKFGTLAVGAKAEWLRVESSRFRVLVVDDVAEPNELR